ncbi:small nuclear ribonucleoprotein Sm D3 [Coemansia sp. RSA 989]|nr:Sm-like ribonucleoprotein [Coemansia mojavensis]KAJ1743306.1 small nuclear ribonucleoprotein Sm D3 [Coemansia sp. RSA 1086]KAJ1752978.1 small nuclear ribonucleoprotein Sm D3 [Coemansia sp. RSA 1821]KAJ1866684.1 small nuclear ribonucleoprotein Sm D3 [Coemansia sp. RSA 989]KAJ1875493.1 small nuclear ribonucleoprotein Sm D3 [Coemansia sp. RSA 990]KAJ2631045.1 small nuclear ribonucleoprotein Sm D3 [Coemansia sp. RSA 1290]KAJ2651930.1 small nuclear ribonucleoprotein Sm D3 [Coemansia sp. RSA 125
MSIGVPVKLLHESQGHVITLELKTGQLYRGELVETEDNMNVQLKDITVTGRDGRTQHLKHVYVRGSNVRFFIVPDMLKNAPMFKNMDPRVAKMRGIGMGRGKAALGRTRGRGRGGSSSIRGRGR